MHLNGNSFCKCSTKDTCNIYVFQLDGDGKWQGCRERTLAPNAKVLSDTITSVLHKARGKGHVICTSPKEACWCFLLKHY